MNALDAKRIAEEALSKETVARQNSFKNIKRCIEDRAKSAHFDWQNPWHVDPWMTNKDKEILTAKLREEGFKVVEREDPDIGNPSSTGGYTEIRWD